MEFYVYFLIAGFVVTLAGGIWGIVQGFQVHVGWGLGLIFVPFIFLFFLISYWDKAKYPFFVNLLGLALIGAGIYMGDMTKVV